MGNDYRVYLGLGSNQDQPPKQITTATKHIASIANTRIIKVAPWYKTKPWGVTDQADFINTVIAIKTGLSPLALLKQIKRIEYQLMTRQINQRWHSRCIDIDILYYENRPFVRQQLQLPHLFLAERCFVMRPLLDIKPQRLPLAAKRAMMLNKSCCHNLQHQRNTLESKKIQQIIRTNR